MSLWFCQKCKCTSDFEECEGCGGPADELLFIPRAELEELVGALELQLEDPDLARCEYRPHFEIAAKCRAKHLEAPK